VEKFFATRTENIIDLTHGTYKLHDIKLYRVHLTTLVLIGTECTVIDVNSITLPRFGFRGAGPNCCFL